MSGSRTYNTRGRQIILDIISNSEYEHITIAEIITLLEEKGLSIGLTTVYRQLERLESEGLVRKYFIDGIPAACFEVVRKHGDCSSHVHFKCEECGKLSCIDCDEFKAIEEHFSNEHGIKLDTVKTVLYGKCKACREKDGQ